MNQSSENKPQLDKINSNLEFELEDERFYFKKTQDKSHSIYYVLLTVWLALAMLILHINWVNLNEYNSIKSDENYPLTTVYKDQISFYGDNYTQFKNNSKINKVLNSKEVEKYWNNCIGRCEIPSTERFYLVSNKPEFINWACNERNKELHYSGTQFAIWKINKQGCVLTNLEQVKNKDKQDIDNRKWQKQKEMEIYLILLLLTFLCILHSVKKLIKNKRLK